MVSETDAGSVDSVVKTVLASAKAQFASVSTGLSLAIAELRVAVSHAGLIICLLIVMAGMSVVGWGLLLIMGALLLTKLGFSTLLAVFCMFLANAVALLIVGVFIRQTLKHLSFQHTREALSAEVSEPS